MSTTEITIILYINPSELIAS